MMPHLKGGLFNAVLFLHTVVLLVLTRRCAGQSQLVGPSQPIVAIVGDDIILPCHLEPAVDASGMTVEWTRPDLNPRFVHVWRDGVELESKKHPSYRGRTSLFVNNLKDGDVSLKLSKVKLSDEGKYRCFIPALGKESTVDLIVGQSQLVGPSQPIVATVGDDIILPCHLETAADASDMIVEWARPDLDPRLVHVWRDGVELVSEKHPSYRGRTSLLVNNLKHGDLSLKLSKVKLSDEGKYRCFLPTLGRESTVELVVGVVSTIVVSLVRTQTNEDISGLVLQCESEGWYPEPEVSWLDGEGHVLSAGPTETVRGPDGLYTVSSRVTVEKRRKNSFTCRVQQKKINQTRETQIRVPEDVFMVQSSPAVCIIVVFCVFGFLLCSAAFLVFLKRRQSKGQNKKHHSKETEAGTGETEQLCTGNTTLVVLDHKQLEEKEEEKKVMIHVITVLMEQKKDLENSINKLKSQLEKVLRETRENEKEFESVDSELFMKDSKKKKLSEVKQELDNKKTEYEKSLQSTEEKLQTKVDVITRITEWKKKIDDQIEQMKEQTDETKRQTDETELQSEKEEETNKTTDPATLIEGHLITDSNDTENPLNPQFC